jgi:hypothetical protein
MSTVEWTPEQAALVERVTAPAEATKRCPGCTTVKPAGEFYAYAERYDGLTAYCRPCHLARSRVRSKARNRALSRLSAAHRAEFDVLYADELAKLTAHRPEDP